MNEIKEAISGPKVWQKFEGRSIPGSTRVPYEELIEAFKGKTKGLFGLDLGSGSGRSTEVLKKKLNCEMAALDLSLSGLQATSSTEKKTQASGVTLPFKENTFDFVNMNGVMTNIVDRNPARANKFREQITEEVFRCLKNGGVLTVADFCADHVLTGYPVNYRKHHLITGELGTIAVFDPDQKITFSGKSDQEVAYLTESPYLVRFAHHYYPQELIQLFQNAGFSVERYTIEIGKTPSRTPIENIILVAKKPLVE